MTHQASTAETPRAYVDEDFMPGLEAAYQELAPRLYNLLCRKGLTDEEAMDAVQIGSEKALKSRHLFDSDQGTLKTWLARIMFNAGMDIGRHATYVSKRTSPLDDMIASATSEPGADPEEAALHVSARNEVAEALADLPDKYQTVLQLRYWHELGYKEIGELLQLDPNVVKARLNRARTLIKVRHPELANLLTA